MCMLDRGWCDLKGIGIIGIVNACGNGKGLGFMDILVEFKDRYIYLIPPNSFAIIQVFLICRSITVKAALLVE